MVSFCILVNSFLGSVQRKSKRSYQNFLKRLVNDPNRCLSTKIVEFLSNTDELSIFLPFFGASFSLLIPAEILHSLLANEISY